MPKCTVLRIKFFSDKKRLVMSLSNGTLLFYNTNENCIQKVFVNKMAIMDLMKIIDDKYLIIAGIDSKVRIWNIDSEKIISKF
jgi:WD40 repeat protein